MADVTKLNIGGTDYNIVDASVPSWAKQSTKPTYTAAEVGALPDSTTIPEYVSDLVDDVGLEPELVLGKYTSGNFYVGIKALNSWSFSNTATSPTEGKIYVDVDKGGECYTYVGHGSKTGYFRISGDVSATLSNGNTSAITSGAVYNALEYKADKIAIITNSSTGDVSVVLEPNKFYKFGSIDSLAITLGSGTNFVIYAGKFTASSSWGGTGLSVPASVTEATNNDTVEAGKTYEFNILDNIIVVKEVA